MSEVKIDKLDERLIHELKKNSRRSVRQLAKSLKESPSTIYNRVKRLEAKEIIRKWTISLDYSLLNMDTIVFIFIAIDTTNTKTDHYSVLDHLLEIEGLKANIMEAHFISGEYDILLKVRADSMKTIGKLIIDKIRKIPGVSKTITHTCFDSLLQECDVEAF